MPADKNVAVVHTRPAGIVKELNARGYEGIACPTLHAVSIEMDVPLADIYIVTSIHALSALPKNKPIVVVGKRTAEEAGRQNIEILGECATVGDLAALEVLKGAKLIHLAGKNVSPDTKPTMNALCASSVCVYEARPLYMLPATVMRALEKKQLAGVLMFSARGAQAFTALAKRATNEDAWKSVTGVALSPRIVPFMSGLPFASIRVAAHPNRTEILKALEQ